MESARHKRLFLAAPMILGLMTIVVVVLADGDAHFASASPRGPGGANLTGALSSGPADATSPAPSPNATPSMKARAGALDDATRRKVLGGDPALRAQGRDLFRAKGCVSCHATADVPSPTAILPLNGWRARKESLYNTAFFENRLAARIRAKGPATAAVIDRMVKTPRGDARLLIWLEALLNDPLFDKPRDYPRPPRPMPSYRDLQGRERAALLAYLLSLD